MSIKEILIKARAVIEDPANWMQGSWSNEDATCFCAMGAIGKAIGFNHSDDFFFKGVEVTTHPAHKALCDQIDLPALSKELGSVPRTFAAYNDKFRHEDVLAVFDRAIAQA